MIEGITGCELRTLKGHSAEVVSVAFSSDGKTLVSGSFDHTIKLWVVASGSELRALKRYSHQFFKSRLIAIPSLL